MFSSLRVVFILFKLLLRARKLTGIIVLFQRALGSISPSMETSQRSWSWKIPLRDDQGKRFTLCVLVISYRFIVIFFRRDFVIPVSRLFSEQPRWPTSLENVGSLHVDWEPGLCRSIFHRWKIRRKGSPGGSRVERNSQLRVNLSRIIAVFFISSVNSWKMWIWLTRQGQSC